MSYHDQLRRTITGAIDRGELVAGDRIPPIRAICGETGLAYATVSRAIRDLVDAGILQARRGAGTTVAPRPEARANPGYRSVGIAGMTPVKQLVQSAYFQDVFLNLQELFVNRGYVVSYDRWSADRAPMDLFDKLRSVEGVIAFGTGLARAEDLLPLAQSAMPLVVVGDEIRERQLHIVHSDNVYGARTAVESLIERGHRRIMFSGRNFARPAVAERLQGYREAMEAAGLPIPGECVTEARGVELGMYLAAMADRPTALFVATDIVHMPNALPALYANGIHIGRDLYVCAYDERGFGVLASMGVAYSRVNQPTEEVARLAAGVLLDVIDGRPVDTHSMAMPLPQVEHVAGTSRPHLPETATVVAADL